MLSPQPFALLKYLSFKKRETRKNINCKYFLSWEDALWVLLSAKKVPQGSKILLPSFFCPHVVRNMEAHNLNCVFYKVDKSLQITSAEFSQIIDKEMPNIIVILNAVGIKNPLLSTDTKWLSKMHDKTILIEDCVHQVLETKNIKLLHPNHYLIDSWRKVLPLQGSALCSAPENLNFIFSKSNKGISYQLRVFYWWLLMQFGWHLKLYKLGEKAMLKGYDVIGDFPLGATNFNFFNYLHSLVDFERLKKIKTKQVERYEKFLATLFEKQGFFKPAYTESDKGELRGFPLGLENTVAPAFLKAIRQKKLLLRFELEGSLWSQNQKLIYLPLGPEVDFGKQKKLCELLLLEAEKITT